MAVDFREGSERAFTQGVRMVRASISQTCPSAWYKVIKVLRWSAGLDSCE